MCRVSIIIPIYKVEAYLAACLESVRDQTMPDFEVLMVDDGSPDNSAAICRRFAAADARFVLIQQPNGGVTAARRAGVTHAKGEFIAFVDGDDRLPLNALDVLLRNMNDEVDIVVGQPDCEPLVTERLVLDIAEYRQKLIYGRLYLAMWARLFRRSLFDDFTFEMPREIRSGEDWIANLRLAFRSEKRVCLLPDVVYHYDMRDTGVSATIRRTVEHEYLVYEALCASVPADYLPDVAAAYALIWIRYTKRMVTLTPEAEAFRKSMLAGISHKLATLRCRDRLFLLSSNPTTRWLLIVMSKLNGYYHRLRII